MGRGGGLITKELHHYYIIIAYFCHVIIASKLYLGQVGKLIERAAGMKQMIKTV